jgi:tetratricopeptide (TPR) repeat protein
MSEDELANPANQTRLEALWDAVRSLPEAERRGFLDALDDDPGTRKELESLLARGAEAEKFFGRFALLLHEAAEGLAREMPGEEEGPATDEASSVDANALDTGPLIGHMAGRYRIETRLGEGGMGVVYRAFDTQLRRVVALKFLPARLRDDTRAKERFLTEARAAAQLDHPNICHIHEVGGGDGTPEFISMAFYDGRTLEETLKGGLLPLSLAVQHATQIARALAAAHARGIVHRDLKPANVMITGDGVVKLLDFGIASMPDVALSHPGVTPGTIGFMSPEQLTSASVDHRTDLWSLGVVLYEMCTGVRPFHRGEYGATIHAILHEDPAPPSSLRSEIPGRIDYVIDRLLRKDSRERFPDAGQLLAALAPEAHTDSVAWSARGRQRGRRAGVRRVIVGAATAAVLVAASLAFRLIAPGEPGRILVADAVGMDTLSANLVSERLRQSLASPGVTVASRASLAGVLARMGRAPDARLTPNIAREVAIREGFKGLVHVTLDRIGQVFSIGAILVDAETGEYLDHRVATAMNAAELPSAADALADGLRQRLSNWRRWMRTGTPLLAQTADSTSALRIHLQAVQANRNGDFLRGIELLDQAIAIDPQFADAYLTRAFALEQIGLRAGKAQSSILNAHQLRSGLRPHERYLVEADYHSHVEGTLSEAIKSLGNANQVVRELQPGRVLNRRSYGLALMLHGDLPEATVVLDEGVEFAPCPATNTHLVSVLYALNKEGKAREILDAALELWPTNPFLGMDRAHFAARKGRYRDAHESVRSLRNGYTMPFALRAEAIFDAVEGRLSESMAHLRELRDERLRKGLLAPALEINAAIGRLRLVARDTAGAIDQVSDFLDRYPFQSLPPEERPYLVYALFFADAGYARHARHLLADYDSLVPDHFKGPDRWMQHRVRASLFMATDSPALALAELHAARNADRLWSEWPDNRFFTIDQRPELANVYERLGQPDSAITVFERYLDAPVLYRAEMDAFHIAHVLTRLEALYAQRNQPRLAARYWRRLTDLWHNADPELKERWGLR